MRTIAGITATSASVGVLAEQPGPAAPRDLVIHARIGAPQAVERGVHVLLGKALATHREHELPAQRLCLRHRLELLLAHRLEARQEGEIEGRHPHGGGRHLVDEAHQRAHVGARDRLRGVKLSSGATSSRYSMMTDKSITMLPS